MADEELPKEKTKEINGVQLTNVEISKIAMICDYLVLDRFNDISSFFRFEKCFGPLLSKEDPNLLIEAFQEICGPKKKYINFGRLISAYIKWKTNSSQNENFNKFMKIVFNDMIKTENEVVGKLEEGTRIFSTKNTRGRKVISKFGVFTDSSKNCIQGFNIQYDDAFDSLLCVKKKPDQDKDITLEMNFLPNGKTILDRDGISHIAGKFSVKDKIVKFLIFKCRSGKTFCIGDNTEGDDEEIELFIFGTSSCQLKTLRIETINDRLAYLEPKFQPSVRLNQKIIPFEEIDDKFINDNIINSQLIFEENDIINVPAENLDQKTLLIPCIEDDAFIADKGSLTEELYGKDFNDVYKFYLERENKIVEKHDDSEGENKKDELKSKMIENTIKRIGLLKYFIKKLKVKENINVLKNEKKNDEERINMDKYLAKIKRFKKKMNKKKEDLSLSKKKSTIDDYEQDEDWPDDEENQKEDEKEEGKVEEIKEEEIKEEGKVEEIKEEGKVEEKVEEGKVEEKKEEEKVEEIKPEEKVEEIKGEEKVEEIKGEEKVEEIKEGEKVEEIKQEEKKEDEEKIEVKMDVPIIEKEEEKNIEIKEENKKDEEIKIQDSEDKNIDSNKVEEIKVDENQEEEAKKNNIRLKGNRPKKLLNKSKLKKEEEIKEPEEKKEIVEEIKEAPEEIKEAVPEGKKEKIEVKAEAPEEIKEVPDDKKEKIEAKVEAPEEKKEVIEAKNEAVENKNEIIEEKKETEIKKEIKEENKITKTDKEDKNKINEEKKEDDNNGLNSYEDNKLKDDEKEENKEDKNDEEKNAHGKCMNCVLF